MTKDDLPRLNEICANVFGGNDYMPKIVPDLLGRSDTHLYVLTDATSVIVALSATVLVDENSTAFFFGTRVAEEQRGRGLGHEILRRQVEAAWQMSGAVKRIRWTRNAVVQPTARMAAQAGFREILNLPLIRIQGHENLAWLRGQPPMVSSNPILQKLTLAELQKSCKKGLTPLDLVVLPGWKAMNLFNLPPGSAVQCVAEVGSFGEIVSFSLSGIGKNSVHGETLAVFVSPTADLIPHINAHASDLSDLEVFTFSTHRDHHPVFYSRNAEAYQDAAVAVVELQRPN